MLRIDGSAGEGGGQVLRTSLSLSALTGQPFRMVNVRARRRRPGLLRQHLTALEAAAAIAGASVEGAAIGSGEVVFRPGSVQPGHHAFSVGTAGSATLVLQTVLPPLLVAAAPSTLALEGGTHNPMAPSFDFLERVFLPLVRRMGARVDVSLDAHGFYPAGGGRFRATVVPCAALAPMELVERGEVRGRRARAVVSALPRAIAERELRVVGELLGWDESCLVAETVTSRGPGNAVAIEIESERVTEVFTGFGERGVRAEVVAGRAAAEALEYLASGAPVGHHLADQLLLPLAVAGGGAFRSLQPSLHARTQAEIIRLFLGVETEMARVSPAVWHVTVGRSAR
ncbi:MAG TPA: RNA 3'-terminal phosphate cyclase [Kofleriaceae bacterium]|nr:RNA 3'-terminal phosphate cyclase [Kofleriaceae bacterium]